MANQLPEACWDSLGENGAFLRAILAGQTQQLQQLQLQNQELQNHFINTQSNLVNATSAAAVQAAQQIITLALPTTSSSICPIKAADIEKFSGDHTETEGFIRAIMSSDDLLSTLKVSQSFFNSDLQHLQSPFVSDLLLVPETLQCSPYSNSLPVISNTVTHSFHPNTSSNTSSKGSSKTSASSKGNSQTSSNSTPSDATSALMSSEHSWSQSGDGAAPAVVGVICNIKG